MPVLIGNLLAFVFPIELSQIILAVDFDAFRLSQPVLFDQRQHKCEDLFENIQRKSLTDACQARMLRCVLMQFVPGELPRRQTVATSPRDAASRINTLEVPHEDHAEVDAWWNARTTIFFTRRFAQRLGKSVKIPVTKNAIESIIKHMPDRNWKLRRCKVPAAAPYDADQQASDTLHHYNINTSSRMARTLLLSRAVRWPFSTGW